MAFPFRALPLLAPVPLANHSGYEHHVPAVQGSLVCVHLVRTYGDPHYIGLDGLEIYDEASNAVLAEGRVGFSIVGVPSVSVRTT